MRRATHSSEIKFDTRIVRSILICALLGLFPLARAIGAISGSDAGTRNSGTDVVHDARDGTAKDDRFFSLHLPDEPNRPRNFVYPPLLSAFLPGFDQWWEGQYQQASAFTGSAALGLGITIEAGSRLTKATRDSLEEADFFTRDDDLRRSMLGLQIYSAAGSFSAFHSFRSATKTHSQRFQFLEHDESVGELLQAPFEFSLLSRSTTWIPLGIVLGVVAYDLHASGTSSEPFRASDLGFSLGFSYLAGTHEEALFRGYMMPVLMESWRSAGWSNFATALTFAAAHYGPENRLPLPQFALGWYLGHMTIENGWSLREAIFVHTWWDVIAFTGLYLQNSSRNHEAWLRLPAFVLQF